jgi:hypothetical protein
MTSRSERGWDFEMILFTAGQVSHIPVRQFGGYWWGCRRRAVVTVASGPKLCTVFVWCFTFCAGKCFGFKQWQLLHTGNSFPYGLGVHNLVTSFWKGGGHIFVTKCDKRGSKFYSKFCDVIYGRTLSKASRLAHYSIRNEFFFRKEYNGRDVKLIFRLHLTSMVGMNGAVILRLLLAFMSCTGAVTLCAPPG